MLIYQKKEKVSLIFMAIWSYLLLIPTAFAATDCAVQIEIPQAQCQALVDLYSATNGASWTDSPANNWNVTNTPCSWTGVTCSGGNVTGVSRSSKNLVGTIPSSLNNLTGLIRLWLSQNQLSGTIPMLPAGLTEIYLDTNQLSGSIPTLPTGLTYLWLARNQLTGIIPTLPTGLITLFLDDNQLTGTIPTSLPTGLTHLVLSQNQLTGTIPTLPTGLIALFSDDNQLTGTIPTSLPTGLTHLVLSQNQLTGTIPSLPSGLTSLFLQNNAFTGTLPSIAGLTGLTSPNLGLSYNALTGAFTGEDALVSSKQAAWKNTQTVSPINVSTIVISSTSVQVNWTPITYTADGGYYQVKYATTPGGTYTNASSTTANKSANTLTVTGLSPSTTYYFVVETFTPSHGLQQNNLISTLSSEISATTLASICPSTITVMSPADDGTVGTLRHAVANVCANGIIDFAPNLANQTITLTSKITFTQNVALQNLNAPGLNISGGNNIRLFHINAGVTVTLDKLNVINGKSGAVGSSGGAFVNYGTLNFRNGNCANNQAFVDGGCIVNHPGATLNFITSTCDQNQTTTYGGCIYNEGTANISGSTLSNNSVTAGGGGGAIFNTNLGSSTISDSTFQLNSATSSGGAIFSNGGTVTVARSTFSQNSATSYGGAIRNDAPLLVVSNSTFFNNTSAGSAAIHNYAGAGSAIISLINNTIAGNSSYGVMNNTNGTLHLKNTVIANNTGGDCSNLGTLASNLRNLVKDNSCSPALSADPQLATALALNGATATSPLTLALSPTSPAINAGDAATCAASLINNVDQRGITRPQGVACDIGAFEASLPLAPTALQIQSRSNTSLQLSWTDMYRSETELV